MTHCPPSACMQGRQFSNEGGKPQTEEDLRKERESQQLRLDLEQHYSQYSPQTQESLRNWTGEKIDLDLVESAVQYICEVTHYHLGHITLLCSGMNFVALHFATLRIALHCIALHCVVPLSNGPTRAWRCRAILGKAPSWYFSQAGTTSPSCTTHSRTTRQLGVADVAKFCRCMVLCQPPTSARSSSKSSRQLTKSLTLRTSQECAIVAISSPISNQANLCLLMYVYGVVLSCEPTDAHPRG